MGGTAGNDSLTGGGGVDTFAVASTGDVTISDLGDGSDVLTVASTTGSLVATTTGFTATASNTTPNLSPM